MTGPSIVNLKGRTYFECTVEEVHSGDDLILMVDLGVDALYKKVRARLAGVDTPDAYKAGQDTEAGEVRELVRKLTRDKKCFLDLQNFGKGGWIVVLHIKDSNGEALNLNQYLMEQGHVYQNPRTQNGSSDSDSPAAA